jgi:hypothetical protein
VMRTYRPRYLIHSAAAAEAEATSCYRDALIKALVEERQQAREQRNQLRAGWQLSR